MVSYTLGRRGATWTGAGGPDAWALAIEGRPRAGRHRARSLDEKRDRQEAILAAARSLFFEQAWGAITVARVAERASLAKGTVYLYFRTKEEMFLTLVGRELAAFLVEVEERIGAEKSGDPVRVGRRVARTVVLRPELRALLPLLHAVLEQNVAYEAALRFKEELLMGVVRAGKALADAVPGLSPASGTRFLLRLHALVIGLTQMASPSAVVKAVLAQPHLSAFDIDFARELEASAPALLAGLVEKRKRRTS